MCYLKKIMMNRILKSFISKVNTMKDLNTNSGENNGQLKYSTQNLPFLLNYEYFSLAWGKKHEGYFIDSLGNILSYNMPTKWNFYTSSEEFSSEVFWGYEIDGQISPKHLFENLNSLKKKSSDCIFINISIDEIVQNLTESGFEYSGGGCDMGIRSYSILIFENNAGQYKRIILKTIGDECLTNKSSFTTELLKCFNNT